MQTKLFPQIIAGIVCAVIFFVGGAAAGWALLIAPAEGPKDPFDINNVEILLLCGLIPSVLGGVIGVSVSRIVGRRKEFDS